jgi:hypothetical protein
LVETLITGPVDDEIIFLPLLTSFLGNEVLLALLLVPASPFSESSSMTMMFYSLIDGLNMAFDFILYFLVTLVEFLLGFCDIDTPLNLFPLTAAPLLLVDDDSCLTVV